MLVLHHDYRKLQYSRIAWFFARPAKIGKKLSSLPRYFVIGGKKEIQRESIPHGIYSTGGKICAACRKINIFSMLSPPPVCFLLFCLTVLNNSAIISLFKIYSMNHFGLQIFSRSLAACYMKFTASNLTVKSTTNPWQQI